MGVILRAAPDSTAGGAMTMMQKNAPLGQTALEAHALPVNNRGQVYDGTFHQGRNDGQNAVCLCPRHLPMIPC